MSAFGPKRTWDRMKYAVGLDAYEINLSDEELSRAPLFEGDEEFD